MGAMKSRLLRPPLRRAPLYLALLGLPCAALIAPLSQAQTVSSPTATPETLDAVTVTGSNPVSVATPAPYAGGQVARGGQVGMLGNLDGMSSPFTLTSYTAKLIEDQQARTLGDVLKNDSSVQVGSGFGNQAELFVIRGFPLNNDDLSFNGLYGILPRQVLPIEMVERVEVFKGASAFLNGAAPGGSGLGGMINIQPKRATDEPITRLNLDYTSKSQGGGGIDLGRRWGEDNKFGIRINAAHHDGETAVDDADRRITMGSIGLDYRGERLRVSLDAGYQKVVFDHPRPSISVTGKVPDPPSHNVNYGQPWAYSSLESQYAVTRAEYDLTPDWMVYGAVGTSTDKEHGQYSQPTVNAQGIGTQGRLGVPFRRDSVTGETGLRGQFDTGPVSHRVNLSVSALKTTKRAAYTFSGPSAVDINENGHLPYPATIGSGGDYDDPNITGRTTLHSIAASDTLGFLDDRVLFTFGLRRQTLQDEAYDYTQVKTADYDRSITTPVYGLVVKPWEEVAFYANHIEGLTRGDQAPLQADGPNTGQLLAPQRTKQTEAGVKLDLGKFGGSLGVFQIEKPQSYVNPNTKVFAANGRQRNNGVELNVYGEPLQGFRVLGGVTIMDATLHKTAGGVNDGNKALGVPDWQAVLGAEYDIQALPGLTVLAQVFHTGQQYVNPENTAKIPAWTRFDVGARYGTKIDKHNVIWRAGVENVTNRNYWSSVEQSQSQVNQGAPRTFKLSMSVDF
jgi:iron complex outermembrane receptor protein